MTSYDKPLQNDEVASSKEPPSHVFVGSNFHTHELRKHTERFTRKSSKKTFPRNVTLGFRNNFWKVFSQVTQYDKADAKFEWLGRSWIFREFWVAESSEVDFAVYLDDPQNVFVVIVISPDDHDEYTDVRALAFQLGLSEQEVVSTLVDALDGIGSSQFLKTFKHDRELNGLFTWSTKDQAFDIDVAVSMFSFYAFCLLMTWKISRDQTSINLKIEDREFRDNMLKVLHIRSQIINVERYFMTNNISNDPKIKSMSRSIKDRFRIQKKLDGFLPLNEAMERHLTTAAQLRTDSKISTLNVTAFIIAFLGLPIAAISMLLAISGENLALTEGLGLLADRSIVILAASVSIFTVTAIFLLAVVIYYIQKVRG